MLVLLSRPLMHESVDYIQLLVRSVAIHSCRLQIQLNAYKKEGIHNHILIRYDVTDRQMLCSSCYQLSLLQGQNINQNEKSEHLFTINYENQKMGMVERISQTHETLYRPQYN